MSLQCSPNTTENLLSADEKMVDFPNHCYVVGHSMVHLFEVLRYKLKGRGFDSYWCHWNFSLT